MPRAARSCVRWDSTSRSTCVKPTVSCCCSNATLGQAGDLLPDDAGTPSLQQLLVQGMQTLPVDLPGRLQLRTRSSAVVSGDATSIPDLRSHVPTQAGIAWRPGRSRRRRVASQRVEFGEIHRWLSGSGRRARMRRVVGGSRLRSGGRGDEPHRDADHVRGRSRVPGANVTPRCDVKCVTVRGSVPRHRDNAAPHELSARASGWAVLALAACAPAL